MIPALPPPPAPAPTVAPSPSGDDLLLAPPAPPAPPPVAIPAESRFTDAALAPPAPLGPVASTMAPPASALHAAPPRRPDGPNPLAGARVDAGGGAAPAGASLLAVLASYVLPGAGLPGTQSLLLLLQLAVLFAAWAAPRAARGERIVALYRLGHASGHRLAVQRPG
jgi:hypothetical protein